MTAAPCARWLDPVCAIAQRAAEAILAVYAQDFEVICKDDNSPVTAADLAAQRVIEEGLRELAPGVPVISEEALAAPRFHQQWQPDELRIERSVRDKVLRKLEQMGHRLNVVDSLGATQAVGWNEKKKTFVGIPDPRGEGKAAAF